MSWLDRMSQRYRVASDPLRTERRLELVLVVMVVLLALLLLYSALRWAMLSAPETVLPAQDSLQVGSIAPRFRPEAADSREIRSRPLFWAGRRPQEFIAGNEPEPESKEESKGLKGVKLVGVFGAGESAGIIVQGKNGKRRLLVGQEVDGWALAAVNPNEVTLTRRGETRALVLRQQEIEALPEVEVDEGDGEKVAETKAETKRAKAAKKPQPRAAGTRSASQDDDGLRVGGSISRPMNKK